MNDNLFDTKFTFMDFIKICLLIVTMFSTWNIVDIVTPDVNLAFVRKIAAVLVVEGAFLGFERATGKAKSKRQVQLATIGFFCSLAVIGVFAALSGVLEFGGETLLDQPAGDWLGIAWTIRYWVILGALVVLVAWLVGLASIHRLYTLADPDKKAELDRISLDESVTNEANKALELALEKARPVIASVRAEATIRAKYKGELKQDELELLVEKVRNRLNDQYNTNTPPPASPASPANSGKTSARSTRCPKCESLLYADGFCPTCEKYQWTETEAAELQPAPLPLKGFSGNGNGHHAQK